MPKYIRSDQLAEQLGVARSTVRKWARERRLPCLRPSPRVTLFDPIEVQRVLAREAVTEAAGTS